MPPVVHLCSRPGDVYLLFYAIMKGSSRLTGSRTRRQSGQISRGNGEKKMQFKSAMLVCFAFFLVLVGTNAESVEYQIRDLGTYGTSASALSINEQGQIVGNYLSLDKIQHGLIWNNGVAQELNPLGSRCSVASDINDSGHVVGEYETESGVRFAYIWKDGSFQSLGTLGGSLSVGTAINNSGSIAGAAYTTDEVLHACVWNNEQVFDLRTLGGDESKAHDINSHGSVVGESVTAENWGHAFIWKNGTMKDLGTLDGDYCFAYGINDNDWIVGETQIQYIGPHAFLWRDNVMQDIGTLGGEGSCSIARSVNSLGQIVGESSLPGSYHAFLWQNDVMLDLGTLGGNSSVASDINDKGWIVGTAEDESGIMHAVLWEPVPEPSSILALICGISGFGCVFLKRKSA